MDEEKVDSRAVAKVASTAAWKAVLTVEMRVVQ